jgi:hypothetical protein
MTEESIRHLERAEELLGVADENLKNNHPSDSISRAYYAMFHAATAVLKTLGIERGSHHALWAAFGEYVTGKGLLDVKYHRLALDAFSARSLSDYLAQPEDTIDDARENLAMASDLVGACRKFVETRARE